MSNYGIKRRKLRAFSYLCKLKKYKIVHSKTYVSLYHYGRYGWCSAGSYNDWKEIDRVMFYE